MPADRKKNCDQQSELARAALNRAQKLILLTKEIGIPQLAEFAGYQLTLKNGSVAKSTPAGGLPPDFDLHRFILDDALPIFDQYPTQEMGEAEILQRAQEIIDGSYHPFGGNASPLSFELPQSPLTHWTKYGDNVEGLDIKWIWEPARFTWAFDLARACLRRPDPRYAECFWRRFDEFVSQNPVNLGPNWVSAQEAAIRIITWCLLYPIFSKFPSTTSERKTHLAESIWQHAARIPPSLGYARSQNNNHLLSEALGLIIAGTMFSPVSNMAKKWLATGMVEFDSGLIKQIEADGTYGQHSANYHRLMLHLALLYYVYAQRLGSKIPDSVSERLAQATRWAIDQLDPVSGRLPNLGHNDGSLLLPMGCVDYRDYRPTLQAASLAFLGETCLLPGPWDELHTWLGIKAGRSKPRQASQAVHKLVSGTAWATLRGVRFQGRPAHADQLHVELWWDGINLAQDAGTYAYNEALPWQNALASTQVHNTLSVDGADQMYRAGKFLWIDQANTKWLQVDETGAIAAEHDGFLKNGVLHRRSIRFDGEKHFVVNDILLYKRQGEHRIDLHWLLPDWQWNLTGQNLQLRDQDHLVSLTVSASNFSSQAPLADPQISLIRAGENLIGQRENCIMGWASDTYGQKSPALSLNISYVANNDFTIQTTWTLASRKE